MADTRGIWYGPHSRWAQLRRADHSARITVQCGRYWELRSACEASPNPCGPHTWSHDSTLNHWSNWSDPFSLPSWYAQYEPPTVRTVGTVPTTTLPRSALISPSPPLPSYPYSPPRSSCTPSPPPPPNTTGTPPGSCLHSHTTGSPPKTRPARGGTRMACWCCPSAR